MIIYIALALVVLLAIAYVALSVSARQRVTPYTLQTYQFVDENGKAQPELNADSTILHEPQVYMSLVAPAFDESKRITKMMDETLQYLESRRRADPSYTFELIVVDDGSRDNTVQVVQDFMKRYNKGAQIVKLLPLRVNRGKGFAVKMGMLHARGRYALMVDSDGATDIRDLERLEQQLKKIETSDGLGAALGSRAHLEKTEQVLRERHPLRNLLMHMFHFVVALVGNIWDVKDTQCGFKLFSRAAVRAIFPNQRVDRWCFDIELIRIAHRLRVPLAEVPVNWKEIEGSKLSLYGMLQTGKDVAMIRAYHDTRLWGISARPAVGTASQQAGSPSSNRQS